MGSRRRWALLAVLLVAFTVTAVVAGQRSGTQPVVGVERLGTEAGEPVAGYLRRAWRSLPPRGGAEVWALVQLDGYLGAPATAELVAGTRMSAVVLRVPLPEVQTALIVRHLPGQRPAAEVAGAMRAAGREQARNAREAPPGRRSAVADAEAIRLATGCRCVLAVLVRAEGDALRGLAGRSGVRAVHAAEPGTPPQGLVLTPLLPEQREVAGPVPDDGPIPPRGAATVRYR